MRKRMAILLLMGLVALTQSCASHQKNDAKHNEDAMQQTDGNLEKIYVTGLNIRSRNALKLGVQFIIRGDFPNPAYQFELVDIEEKDNEIILTPLAYPQKGVMALQVLTPFTEKLSLPIQKPGTYKVKLVGRGETIEKTFTVK